MTISKKITVTEMAKLANVSIGTIDRAINDRPGINPKTKERILRIADKYNYRPNRLSKALANNKTVRIGMITLPEFIPFVKSLIQSAQTKAESYFDYGCRLTIRSLGSFNVDEQVDLIQKFIDEQYDAIAIEGMDHPKIVRLINRSAAQGIPVVTFNTDVPLSDRMCFIGQNLLESGKIAADMLCRFMGGSGDLFVLQGHHEIAAHTERLQGFMEVVKQDFPKVNIVGIEECFDDNNKAYHIVKEAMRRYPGMSGLYAVASGNIGAGNAIMNAKPAQHINYVCNDYVDGMKTLFENNILDATILQDPETQGSMPVSVLFDFLFDKIQPEETIFYTQIRIITKHCKID